MTELPSDCLLLDLETNRADRILKIGGWLDGRRFGPMRVTRVELALADLQAFADSATVVAGHNIVRHDLRVLADAAPKLPLLSLPTIDTLLLSPICFPQNPYHRLVKDYKLVPMSVNDPTDDAALCGVLLADEVAALRGLAEGAPAVYRCLAHLLCTAEGGDLRLAAAMRRVFEAAAGLPALGGDEAVEGLRGLLADLACRTAASFVSAKDLATGEGRWSCAYALTWLRVAGGDSVVPPWVRIEYPQVSVMLRRLRDVPCDAADCAYCRAVHNPEEQLRRFFRFDAFRPAPASRDGGSLQRAIVAAGLRGDPLLAVMPTGGGKSLCFQLPALARSVRRGQLTVVVSPLQALMKDQVDGLVRRTGLQTAAALYGLLTPPERGAVLRGIAAGSIGLLYLSPEQLRSTAVRRALLQREIGCWVLDEAHCLSKWGHDFRPDYLYVGRYIRELARAQQTGVPSIACFTATAKREVVEEIVEFFRREAGCELARYEATVERDNLQFEVQTLAAPAKLPRIDDLLHVRLPADGSGSAVVFRATRSATEETADYLRRQGWAVEHFHAGLLPSEKKRVQNAFLDGSIRVICATNAFGMGIDKEDVRLVIHGDTPGSLENYLQEAGRAGRDSRPAECVLLFDDEDCEQQFRLGAYSELSRRDIAGILRGLRRAASRHGDAPVEITTGELLRDEAVETGIDPQERDADTRVRAAISWLERAGFVERGDNRTNVIQARLKVRSLEEARAKLSSLNLSAGEEALWMAIVRELLAAGKTDTLAVDTLAALPEFQGYLAQPDAALPERVVREGRSQEYLSGKVLKVLSAMSGTGLLKKDTRLTAYVRYKVSDHSGVRLERILQTERALIALLREQAPDPEGWVPLDARLVNHGLTDRGEAASVELVRSLLRSLTEDGRGFAGHAGSLDVRYVARDRYRVHLNRPWDRVAELAEKRGQAARRILGVLLDSVGPDTPPGKDVLVDFSFEDLAQAIERDAALRADVRDTQALIERALMFLHEQDVIVLQKGLAIFRSAMTIRVLPDAASHRYTQDHYRALQHHYRERVFQVHVMSEYARRGLGAMRQAMELVLAYFSLEREAFIRRFFDGRADFLERATTARSYRAIVDALGNRAQMRIVTADPRRNRLILAGPGSGKTRTVVHRCAYLLRVKRVRPEAILVCCFNRRAAVDLRRRLRELAGNDARGVTVQTYHGLALRLLGRAVGRPSETGVETPDFDALIRDAVALLKGDAPPPGMEPDEVRDRVLAGFTHILVDEYQDIDAPQYDLISAIAGRTEGDEDRRLVLLAVGDDDQSIYGFRGAHVEFIRRFQADYDAAVDYLVENYRSTRYIVEASNAVIARNRERMKTGHPIGIDGARALHPPGGEFGERDPETRGRVGVVHVRDMGGQASGAVREIERLARLGAPMGAGMAVLSRGQDDLAPIRAALEAAGIAVSWPLERVRLPPLHRIREIDRALQRLEARRADVCRPAEMASLLGLEDADPNPWRRLLTGIVQDWVEEAGDDETPVQAAIDAFYEALAQRRRDEQVGDGVVLSTVHAAKGMEYDHVLLCGDWSCGVHDAASLEEQRRVFYVGMTRARKTLTVFDRADCRNPFVHDLEGPAFAHRTESGPAAAAVHGAYEVLGLDDLFLDYAGRRPPSDPVHAALDALEPGAVLAVREDGERLMLADAGGCRVAQLSAKAVAAWRERLPSVRRVCVLAMVVRRRRDVLDPNFAVHLRADEWAVPLCEVEYRPDRE